MSLQYIIKYNVSSNIILVTVFTIIFDNFKTDFKLIKIDTLMAM